MKYIIQPINDNECKIVDLDCSALQGNSLKELVLPSTVEQDGKTYKVKEIGPGFVSPISLIAI